MRALSFDSRLIAGTFSDQLRFMLDEILPALGSGETFAILHPQGGGWFGYVRQTLCDRGIRNCELTRRSEWPSGPELVELSTTYSAKGFEYDHVLLPRLNQEVTPHGNDDGDGRLDSLRRLIAIGIGRAPRSVMIGLGITRKC